METQFQRKTDRFVKAAREASSRGMSFIIVMLGVVLQASHTTLLMYDIAAFEQHWLKLTVALGVGIFISCALAIFTLKHNGTDKKLGNIILVFFYFEIFTNVFYYWNSLIFSVGFKEASTQDWLYLIIAMPFSFIMPYAIKQFAGIINADEKIAFGDIDQPLETSIDSLDAESIGIVKQLSDDVNNLKSDLVEVANRAGNYLQKGENVVIKVGDKKAIVSLGDEPIGKVSDDDHESISKELSNK